MQFLYKIPGYILLLFGGFCLSWGGLIIRSFEEASIWQILFLRSIFFLLALLTFLYATYKKNIFIKIVRIFLLKKLFFRLINQILFQLPL